MKKKNTSNPPKKRSKTNLTGYYMKITQLIGSWVSLHIKISEDVLTAQAYFGWLGSYAQA